MIVVLTEAAVSSLLTILMCASLPKLLGIFAPVYTPQMLVIVFFGQVTDVAQTLCSPLHHLHLSIATEDIHLSSQNLYSLS
jgi:hypothetical protein